MRRRSVLQQLIAGQHNTTQRPGMIKALLPFTRERVDPAVPGPGS